MKLIPCPMNGLRPEDEFVNGGPIQLMPSANDDDAVWVDYLFMEDNTAGEVWEWWCHTPSVFWFAMKRDTRSGACLETLSVREALARLG